MVGFAWYVDGSRPSTTNPNPRTTINRQNHDKTNKRNQKQVEALRAELAEKEGELEELRRTTPADLWLRDLDNLVGASVGVGCVCVLGGGGVKRRGCVVVYIEGLTDPPSSSLPHRARA